MIDAQTLNVVGLVSQMTFALTMVLLALSERRSRGMAWLAAASMTQLLATFSRYMVSHDPYGVMQALGCGLLVLIFFFAYEGLHWFIIRHAPSPMWLASAVSVGTAVIFVIALKSPSMAVFLSRGVITLTAALTIRFLWRTREIALRTAARICAFQFAVMVAVLLFRLYVDIATHGSLQARLSTYGREATLVSVALLFLSFIGIFAAEGKRRLQVETRTDSLTGLSNRRAMEEFAEDAVAFSRQQHVPLALLMLDLDHFKVLNDTWGHWQGDRALHALGAALLQGTRTCDFVARIGGEEFAVLLPGQDMNSALAAAERLRQAVEELSLNEDECSASITVSIGVTSLRDGETTWTDMLRRADRALYRAKREGRNRVVQHSDDQTLRDVERRHRDLRTGTDG